MEPKLRSRDKDSRLRSAFRFLSHIKMASEDAKKGDGGCVGPRFRLVTALSCYRVRLQAGLGG